MKKLTLTALVLVSALTFGSLATAAPNDAKKVKSKVTASYVAGVDDPTDPYDQAYSTSSFNGKVKAKKGCKANRKVKIRGIGKSKTNKRGRYSIGAGTRAPAGNYKVVAKKKKLKAKNGDRIICRRAVSKRVTVS